MENIVINIHEDNLSIFNEKLKELNRKFAKKGLPLINCSMEQKEMEHVDEWTKEKFSYTMYVATLSSDFNNTNLSGIDVEFEGVVSLIEKEESSKKNNKNNKKNKKLLDGKYVTFTGSMIISKEGLKQILLNLGAHITSTVSTNTNILIHGDYLEDGRSYDKGKKYKLTRIIISF